MKGTFLTAQQRWLQTAMTIVAVMLLFRPVPAAARALFGLLKYAKPVNIRATILADPSLAIDSSWVTNIVELKLRAAKIAISAAYDDPEMLEVNVRAPLCKSGIATID